MHASSMHASRIVSLAFAFTGIGLLGAARPTAAQDLTYTLSGVTFNDGATASGYFDYNPATDTFGGYSITTTDGKTDGLIGFTQQPGSNTVYYRGYPDLSISSFSFIAYRNDLILETHNLAVNPGIYSLTPGIVTDPYYLGHSGEFAPTAGSTSFVSTARPITMGFLVVTSAAPVPEASTTVSLGLLLALGGLTVAVKRRKANAA